MSYSKKLLLDMYRALLGDRIMEERLIELYAQGWVPGHIHSGIGEEATYTGVLATRREGDQFKFTHRNVSAYSDVGLSYRHIFCEILGKMGGNSNGKGGINHIADKDKGVIGMCGALGGDIAISVGCAYALQYNGGENMVYCFFGDGTTSRGPVHEAMNWAALWKLPILFVVNNNEFSISTHVSEGCSIADPGAGRAAGYGMPSKVVDGTDVLKVYDAAKELSDYIRGGNGPAVLETKGYRWRGHFEGDQARYRDAAVTEKWHKKDCVEKMERYLKDNGTLSDVEIDSIREEIKEAVEDGISYAEKAPQPDISTIYDNLYAEPYMG